MKDRPWCGNCGRKREEHYADDGSWNEVANLNAGCLEYEGVSIKPSSKELSAKPAEGHSGR